MTTPLPLSFSAYARQAKASLQQALADGHKRLVIDVQNFRRTSPALLKPLLTELVTPFVAVFGTGNAGLGEIEWGEGDWLLLDGGEAMTYLDRRDWQMMLLMDASSLEMTPTQRFWKSAADKPLLMVNSWPEAPGMIGIGRGAEKERTALREQLTVVYYLQALRFQPLVIHRAYPQPWQLWYYTGATTRLLATQDLPFSTGQLKQILSQQPQVSLPERFNAFWNGPKYFQEWDS